MPILQIKTTDPKKVDKGGGQTEGLTELAW